MLVLRPKWPAPSTVKALSTTRAGGHSVGAYGSLNLGDHVGDTASAVAANRAALSAEVLLPSEPHWLQQVHGVELLDAGLVTDSEVIADGSYASSENKVCVVMTADCLPLLLTNVAGSQVAAVHVGWRGLAAGIVERAVKQFNSPVSEIIAWAGPCIGPQKFEVGAEVRDQLGGSSEAYVELPEGKLLANLPLLTAGRLAGLGVLSYSHEEACTYSDPERFFSYRRDGQCGRMATMIWIESDQ